MALLKIKNFGPIKNGFSQNNGFMDIKPVTVICGNQATGKSTFAKLYSSFVWLEKKINSDEASELLQKPFLKTLLAYHKIDSYLKDETEIIFKGDLCEFWCSNSDIKIFKKKNNEFIRPKIEYIPAERNFCTSIPNASFLKGLAKNNFDFLADYLIAAESLNGKKYKLPLNGYEYRYDVKTNSTYISDKNDEYEIDIVNSSSGLQSLSPMVLTSAYYSQLITNNPLEGTEFSFDQEKRWKEGRNKLVHYHNFSDISYEHLSSALKKYRDKTNETPFSFTNEIDKSIFDCLIRIVNSRFVNIVEEPEQNLYPVSQLEILFYLLECFNNQYYNTDKKIENQLLITTHSPYILSYLTLSAKAAELQKNKKIPSDEIEKIVPIKSIVEGKKIAIYETKIDGTIELLEPYYDLPSDENELNQLLAISNEKFSKLLELEEKYCQ